MMGVYKHFSNIVPGQKLYKTEATRDDYREFSRGLKRLPRDAALFWSKLLTQHPALRLRMNIKRVADLLGVRSIQTVIPGGVNPHELAMLSALVGHPTRFQLVGHELLNLRQRQRFVDHFRTIFGKYRCKGGFTYGQEGHGDEVDRHGAGATGRV